MIRWYIYKNEWSKIQALHRIQLEMDIKEYLEAYNILGDDNRRVLENTESYEETYGKLDG